MKARKFVSMLAASAAVLSVSVGAMLPTAARAQIGGVVFDPRNYAQNILTAARTLEQINNQTAPEPGDLARQRSAQPAIAATDRARTAASADPADPGLARTGAARGL